MVIAWISKSPKNPVYIFGNPVSSPIKVDLVALPTQLAYEKKEKVQEKMVIPRKNMKLNNKAMIPALSIAAALAGIPLLPWRRIRTAGWRTLLRDGIKRFFAFRGCVKDRACLDCKYDRVCYGLWAEYAKRRGTGELKPIPGEKITDPRFVFGDNGEKI